MTNRTYTILFLLFFILFISCSEEEKVKSPTEETDKEWIVKKMRDVYLWNDEIPKDTDLDFSKDGEIFFNDLLSNKDGKDTYNQDGKKIGHRFYSAIIKKDQGTKSYIGDGYSFGFEYIHYNITNLKKYALQVSYILPDSPAEKAGMKRGDWIVIINGKQVTNSVGEVRKMLLPETRSSISLGVSAQPNGNDPRTLQLNADIVTDDPVFVHKTINYKGKKVGYMVYNHFTAGKVDNGQDETFNNSMRAAFAQFKTENPEEFIIDFRYNGGGLVTCAQLLATMLAPASTISTGKEVFCKLTDNKKENSFFYFDPKKITQGTHGANLGLSKLYVITSDGTASASEAVINGLAPHMEVIMVGEKTEGKNVGSVTYLSDKYGWELHPIVSLISNSEGFSDYADGLDPDFICTESNQNQFYDLGDEREFILNQVLNYIVDGSPIQSKSTLRSSDINLEPIYNSLDRKKMNSVRLPSDY